MKKLFFGIGAAIIAVAAGIYIALNFQSVDDYYLSHLEDAQSGDKTVTLSIDCKILLKNNNIENLQQNLREYVPKDGILLPEKTFVLRENDTVFDIIDRAVRYYKIQFDYQGKESNTFGSVYIKGVGYLYEFSCGALSGWVYSVNNIFPQTSIDKYTLSDGDIIRLAYTCDLGHDVGDNYSVS